MSSPPTLHWLISDGVTSATAHCRCGRESVVPFERFDLDTPFPDIAKRLRCSKCGARPRQVMPAWHLSDRPGVPRYRKKD